VVNVDRSNKALAASSSMRELAQRALDREPECALEADSSDRTAEISRTTSAPRTRRPARRPNSTAGAVGGSRLVQDTTAGIPAQAVEEPDGRAARMASAPERRACLTARRMKETKNKTISQMCLQGNEGRRKERFGVGLPKRSKLVLFQRSVPLLDSRWSAPAFRAGLVRRRPPERFPSGFRQIIGVHVQSGGHVHAEDELHIAQFVPPVEMGRLRWTPILGRRLRLFKV
jgi:hypothetical protein